MESKYFTDKILNFTMNVEISTVTMNSSRLVATSVLLLHFKFFIKLRQLKIIKRQFCFLLKKIALK